MSVQQALLALLEQGPMYGYQLRAEFEQRTGATWPLNVGQVYTTLARLERDGLVEHAGDGATGRRGARRIYRVTAGRRAEVSAWFTTPVPRTQPPRDELAIKLALAVTRARRRRRRGHPAPAQRDHDARCRTTPGSSARAAPRPDEPADLAWCWSSTRWSSTPRPRSAGSTTARPGCARGRRRSSRSRDVADRDRRSDRRRPEVRPMSAVLQLDDVTRVHGEGATEVHALRGVSLRGARRRAGRGDGAVRLGQVDPAHPGRRARLPDRRHGLRSRASTSAALGQQGRARDAAYVDRLRLPGLQPDPGADRRRERRAAARARRRAAPAPPGALALAALEEVGIADLADRFPDEMSGGQQQRVAIARAIVGERRLILADEPTGALDTETGEEILRLLRARCDAGAAGVLVTHEARHAAWADRVVFLRDGVVVDETGADPAEALLEPADR